MTILLAPFLLGLASSFHCVGMCSPLVMAVSRTGGNAIVRNLKYNAGRILTYGVLGSIVSLTGAGLFLVGIQQWVSIGAGLIVFAIGAATVRVAAPAVVQASVVKIMNILKNRFSHVINKKSVFGVILLGMINGLLPCGMTLVALGYCITLDSPADGFVAMLLFGVGTLPAMVGLSWSIRAIVTRTKISYKTIQAALMIISGLLLVGRGIADIDSLTSHRGRTYGIVICGGKMDTERVEMLP